MFELVIATKNAHKVEEFRALLGDKEEMGVLKSMLDYPNAPVVIEDGDSFEANAEIKALAAAEYTKCPAVADDSGLEVEALDGEPGIYSARYAGEGASDADNVQKLLHHLKGVSNRNARFVCVIAVAFNGEVLQTFRGEVKGKIIDAPRGVHGFGYDPIFVPDGYEQTFAELAEGEKNKISHRAQATAQALEFFEDLAGLLEGF